MKDSVTVQMAAPPEKVWELLSDVTRIGEFSPETFEAEWTGGATGPAVGARFRGHVKRNGRGPTYWAPCKVTVVEPSKAFEFEVTGPKDKPVNTWGYKIEPSETGSDVTEYFQLSTALPFRLYWLLAGRWRGRTNRNGMQTTLERIKAVVEKP
jgi:uncharacterized protein YndB with AHSA1/START domain